MIVGIPRFNTYWLLYFLINSAFQANMKATIIINKSKTTKSVYMWSLYLSSLRFGLNFSTFSWISLPLPYRCLFIVSFFVLRSVLDFHYDVTLTSNVLLVIEFLDISVLFETFFSTRTLSDSYHLFSVCCLKGILRV